MSKTVDTIDYLHQDFFSHIRRLKKNGQFYSLSRLIAGFIRSAQEFNINVSEYEYILQKYYDAEWTPKDMRPQEIDVLVASYQERLQSILDHTPKEYDPTVFVTNEDSLTELEEDQLISNLLDNMEIDEGLKAKKKVKPLKKLALDHSNLSFNQKENKDLPM